MNERARGILHVERKRKTASESYVTMSKKAVGKYSATDHLTTAFYLPIYTHRCDEKIPKARTKYCPRPPKRTLPILELDP